MNGIAIRTATTGDAPIIHRLAHEIWWPAYKELLPHGQIEVMLHHLYSIAALEEQMASGQEFALALREDISVGFIGFRPKPSATGTMRIEKLYILPAEQGKGTGKLLINHAAAIALAAGMRLLELNVYRHNPARAFYERQGFVVVETVEIPFHGYILDDYVMQKAL
ncbi:Acetyltransferase (GNAT) domain-containing protein [Parapedobacter composti]|uniref:Acetyltransferase (GNAT) domain-containing protein n=1 Tax=Parapedobacter composti TaxID=623281 RepID=A0A1I1IIW3_9SPHI|nr:GNAT family N-acetyltransferase [Parapedobacter composti]SFC36177.1 Acetyltransferase (GNAT) domain-containing protein [Parapedobacter composti]